MILRYIACFIVGAIPFSVLIPFLLYGINIIKLGSKNPGTTNVYRILSEHKNKLTAIALTIFIGILEYSKSVACGVMLGSTGALTAVLGQMYSPFLSFSGGKGVAAFLGAFIGTTMDAAYLIAPITWGLLTFIPKTLSFIPNTNDYKKIGPIEIKASFLASLISMGISMTILMFSDFSKKVKLEFIIILLLILYKHIKYIRFSKDDVY